MPATSLAPPDTPFRIAISSPGTGGSWLPVWDALPQRACQATSGEMNLTVPDSFSMGRHGVLLGPGIARATVSASARNGARDAQKNHLKPWLNQSWRIPTDAT
jgi:hypothetical protein